LRRFSIPIAVTGGILCSAVVAGLDLLGGVKVAFDLEVRDSLLLVFFSTIGLSAKLATLREDGRTLALLGGVTLVFLLCQNAIGVSIAWALDSNPAYGLIAGSVSLALPGRRARNGHHLGARARSRRPSGRSSS
jgi:ESS family glutamate:Na+ symporter